MIFKTQLYSLFLVLFGFSAFLNPYLISSTNTSIPEIYYQGFNLGSSTFTYNVTSFDSTIYFRAPSRHTFGSYIINAIVPEGGQIILNLLSFSTYLSWKPTFSDIAPCFNLTFVGNSSYYDVENIILGLIFGCGYNNFYPGFIIPANNLTGVEEEAVRNAKSLRDWYIEGYAYVEEFVSMLKIGFVSIDFYHNITMTYDKQTGILVHFCRYNNESLNPNFEFFLDGYHFDYQYPIIISSYNSILLLSITLIMSLIYVHMIGHQVRKIQR